MTEAAVSRCTTGQAGCSLLKAAGINNATRVELSAWVMVFGRRCFSLTTKTFNPLSLISE
jgi:hypothetical protein